VAHHAAHMSPSRFALIPFPEAFLGYFRRHSETRAIRDDINNCVSM